MFTQSCVGCNGITADAASLCETCTTAFRGIAASLARLNVALAEVTDEELNGDYVELLACRDPQYVF